jgi:hypothetical protein
MSIVTEARDIHIARIEADVRQCWLAFRELRPISNRRMSSWSAGASRRERVIRSHMSKMATRLSLRLVTAASKPSFH